ncbi:MAG TPA: Gfo/Idh/MocA family oxidoreductase [Microlunatus sp.]|nr:Gfo/Idh/MocA family oxidoreductase [Microlunatus sp.]
MSAELGIGLIGAGRIGTSHARLLAERVTGARLVAVADPRPGAAAVITDAQGGMPYQSPADLVADPHVDAVLIAASSVVHAELVELATGAGKPVFCEKPMGMNLSEVDRGITAAERAGVALQVGFNRRFDRGFLAAHDAVVSGAVGEVQLLRSLTRDPGLADPGSVPPWTIFTQTLIHDFDVLNWLNPGADPVEVYATADALVAPDFKDSGLLDTAVVLITYSNGARAVAEASFSAAYGYDVRGEVFGSGGMVTVGDGARSSARLFTATGGGFDTARSDTELMIDSYVDEFAAFVAAVRDGRPPSVSGVDARRALAVAMAGIESVTTHAPATVASPVAAR